MDKSRFCLVLDQIYAIEELLRASFFYPFPAEPTHDLLLQLIGKTIPLNSFAFDIFCLSLDFL